MNCAVLFLYNFACTYFHMHRFKNGITIVAFVDSSGFNQRILLNSFHNLIKESEFKSAKLRYKYRTVD